jgi:hypothetical protein
MSYLLRNQHRSTNTNGDSNNKMSFLRTLSSSGTQRFSVPSGSGQVQVQRLQPQHTVQQHRISGDITMDEGK